MTKCQRRRILPILLDRILNVENLAHLQVRAPNFNYVIECFGFFLESVTKLRESWDQGIVYLSHSCYVHGRRESRKMLSFSDKISQEYDIRIIAALAHVDVIIWMNRLLRALLTP